MKNNGLAHSHHELFEKRRTSVPANTISYISTENVSKAEAIEEYLGTFERAYVIGECGHRRPFTGTGYRCEKHGGGRGHAHAISMSNGASETPRKHRSHYDGGRNASSPSVPAMVNASYSDTGTLTKSDPATLLLNQRFIWNLLRQGFLFGMSLLFVSFKG